MTPEERAARKAARAEAERDRMRAAAKANVKRMLAERGPIPDHLVRQVGPIVREAYERAHAERVAAGRGDRS